MVLPPKGIGEAERGGGFLISSKYFRYFVIISPWLNKLESHLPNSAFRLFEIASVVLVFWRIETTIFKETMHFYYMTNMGTSYM